MGAASAQIYRPFAPADFEGFSTTETRRFLGPELSSIEQMAPAGLNS